MSTGPQSSRRWGRGDGLVGKSLVGDLLSRGIRHKEKRLAPQNVWCQAETGQMALIVTFVVILAMRS